MKSKLKPPSPAMVIALLALIVAVGGTAYAAKKIGTKMLKNGAVKEKKIANGAVSSGKLADKAVTAAKLADASVGRGKLESDQQVMWAYVAGNTIVNQSGGISVIAGSGGGANFIRFPAQLPGRAVIATIGSGQGNGEISSAVCGGTVPNANEVQVCNTTSGADNTTSTAKIETANSAGAATPKNFYVAVLPK
jgi:hypothetical protein